MREAPEPQVSLYVIQAREAPVAVVFRRGPSKRVQLIRWDLETDTFEEGQWLKGRIYERRCDLSPDGNLLVYFAANYKKPLYSWTAVSKPPFLTALALWPKGDGWGGGGLFENNSTISLNHRESEMELASELGLPKNFSIRPFGERPGWGEDNPIWAERLFRDGWRFVQDGETIEHGRGSELWISFEPPEIWARNDRSGRYELRMVIRGLHKRDGPWYVVDHEIIDLSSGENRSLEETSWVDWCYNGDLLLARGGGLYRLKFNDGELAPISELRKLIDLSDRKFEALESPMESRQW